MKLSLRNLSATLLPALIVSTAALGLFFETVSAQQPTPSDDEVNAVAREMYCPVCENVPLDVCPTQACAQWRELIREKLAQGWNEDQIRDYFVLQYGDRVLSEPPMRGFNWLVYVLPPLFILIGVYILVRVLRGSRKADMSTAGASPAPPSQPADDPYISRIEEELTRRSKA